jgi:hypothetical protein
MSRYTTFNHSQTQSSYIDDRPPEIAKTSGLHICKLLPAAATPSPLPQLLMPTTIMSADNSYEQSVGASTPGSDTPSTSDIMSTTPTVELQNTSPTNENIFRSFQDAFASLRAEMTRLEIENKRLVEHNTVIEKELVTLNEHNTVIEKELETLNEDNVKLTGANDDAIKKLAKVEEEKAGLQKELGGLEGLREVLGWKKAAENQERMEKLLENYQQKTEKWIAEVQQQGQQNLEQAIDRINAHHALEMQDLAIATGSMGLEDWKDGYIFREKVGFDDCLDCIDMS